MSPMQKVRKAVGYIISTLENARFSSHYGMTLIRNIMLVINFFMFIYRELKINNFFEVPNRERKSVYQL